MTKRSPDGALTAIDRAREAKGIASRGKLEQYDTQNSRLEVVAHCFASLSSRRCRRSTAAGRVRSGGGRPRSSSIETVARSGPPWFPRRQMDRRSVLAAVHR
ncbi:hypothetical protein MTO96_007308 [Rhipicephalus appendiculatus]